MPISMLSVIFLLLLTVHAHPHSEEFAHVKSNDAEALQGSASHTGHGHTHGFLIKAHGTLLTLTFSFVFPLGVVFIRSGSKKAFFFHWTVQLGSMVTAMVAMLFMIVRSWSHIISGRTGTHHLLGLALFSVVLLQALLGYHHHALYKKLGRRTLISYAHIALGWLVMCAGWINTLLGFQMGGIGLPLTTTWVCWLVVASVLMVKAPTIGSYLSKRSGPKYEVVGEEELKEDVRSSREVNDDSFSIGE